MAVRSRVAGGPLSFGVRGRVLLTSAAVLPVAYGWYGVLAYWGSPRCALDLVWTVPCSVAAAAWTAAVWSRT